MPMVQASGVLIRRPARPVKTALRNQFKTQRAGDRRRFHQLDDHRIAQPVSLAAVLADHGVASLVEAEIFIADGARGNETVGAGVAQLAEQAGASDAGYSA